MPCKWAFALVILFFTPFSSNSGSSLPFKVNVHEKGHTKRNTRKNIQRKKREKMWLFILKFFFTLFTLQIVTVALSSLFQLLN